MRRANEKAGRCFSRRQRHFGTKLMTCIMICAALAAFHDTASARVVRQVHPPPPPRPPALFLQKVHFYKWQSRDVVKAIKDMGLELVDLDEGLTIGAPASKESTIFLIPSYGKDVGGTVSSFDSEDKLRESITYYTTMNPDPQTPAWRIYTKDNILLLISGRVPEEKAREYEKVLNSMDK